MTWFNRRRNAEFNPNQQWQSNQSGSIIATWRLALHFLELFAVSMSKSTSSVVCIWITCIDRWSADVRPAVWSVLTFLLKPAALTLSVLNAITDSKSGSISTTFQFDSSFSLIIDRFAEPTHTEWCQSFPSPGTASGPGPKNQRLNHSPFDRWTTWATTQHEVLSRTCRSGDHKDSPGSVLWRRTAGSLRSGFESSAPWSTCHGPNEC